jgi:transposase
MMGRQKSQVNLMNVRALLGRSTVPEDSLYGRLAEWGEGLLPEKLFASMYSEKGRPSVPPIVLAKALLLMYYEDVSDREAENRARYDLRWKYALNLGLDEAGFDHTRLCRFRASLMGNGKAREVFERFVRMAVKAGMIEGDAQQVIDSTHVLGAGAVQDTYMLMRTAIRKLLKAVGRRKGMREKLADLLRGDYREKGKPAIDWENPEAREALLNEMFEDSKTLLRAVQDMELDEQEKAAKDLLAVVAVQDVEEKPDGDGHVQLRQGVARDRVISTTDSEMRHGHKSAKGRFNGYKAQIMEDPKSELITNVAITPGNGKDGDALPEMVAEQAKVGLKPEAVLGDTAYGAVETRIAMAAQEVEVVAPAVPIPSRQGVFPKSAFDVDLEQGVCRCPAGQETRTVTRHRKEHRVLAFRFDPATCQACPLRDQCTKSKSAARIISIHRHEAALRHYRAVQETPEFKERYRTRPKVERKIADVVHHGMRKARYVGSVKVELQLLMTAAVVNLKRLTVLIPGGSVSESRFRAALAL